MANPKFFKEGEDCDVIAWRKYHPGIVLRCRERLAVECQGNRECNEDEFGERKLVFLIYRN
jgi:hypothetical protein